MKSDDDQSLVRNKNGVIVTCALKEMILDELLVLQGLRLLHPFDIVVFVHFFDLNIADFAFFEFVQTFSVFVLSMSQFEELFLKYS